MHAIHNARPQLFATALNNRKRLACHVWRMEAWIADTSLV
jgi:hypothetical protein